MAEHRKRTLLSIDKTASIDSSVGPEEQNTHRNISKSAWNKIRMVELKKKERLAEFCP